MLINRLIKETVSFWKQIWNAQDMMVSHEELMNLHTSGSGFMNTPADKPHNWVRGFSWQANAETVGKNQQYWKEHSSETQSVNVFKYLFELFQISPGFLEGSVCHYAEIFTL